ncbi:arginase family protein [Algoriphagus boritolerans]|uniref:arginase family protein n=1 Tax=Algoriphagus boritolerans TaxID=308111 RepID=UPI002FCE66DC
MGSKKTGEQNSQKVLKGEVLKSVKSSISSKKSLVPYRIADLGDLISGATLNDTYQNIRQVGEALMKQQILPVFFGGSHDLDYGQYLSYQKNEKNWLVW